MSWSPFEFFDRWWERYRVGKPNLALADRTFDQTHMHHALIVSTIFGPIGWAVYAGIYRHMSPRGYAVGALAGIGFYLVREIIARLHNWRYRIWDGRLDVGLPLWIPGTLALAILFGHVPGWLVALFVALAALIFYSYTFGRPPGALLDDGSY